MDAKEELCFAWYTQSSLKSSVMKPLSEVRVMKFRWLIHNPIDLRVRGMKLTERHSTSKDSQP